MRKFLRLFSDQTRLKRTHTTGHVGYQMTHFPNNTEINPLQTPKPRIGKSIEHHAMESKAIMFISMIGDPGRGVQCTFQAMSAQNLSMPKVKLTEQSLKRPSKLEMSSEGARNFMHIDIDEGTPTQDIRSPVGSR